jgi:hypothetical protein
MQRSFALAKQRQRAETSRRGRRLVLELGTAWYLSLALKLATEAAGDDMRATTTRPTRVNNNAPDSHLPTACMPLPKPGTVRIFKPNPQDEDAAAEGWRVCTSSGAGALFRNILISGFQTSPPPCKI